MFTCCINIIACLPGVGVITKFVAMVNEALILP